MYTEVIPYIMYMLVDLGGEGHGDDAMDRSTTDYTSPIYYFF